MGKKSKKEDKNIFFEARESAELTRAQASEKLDFISESRLEKIETEKTAIHPEDVVAMADAYKRPDLCNYYCSHLCKIGENSIPKIEPSTLAEIVLGMLSSLNSLEKQKERLIEITADGVISDDELPDFAQIQVQLEHIEMAVASLKLWVSNTVAEGKLDKEKYEKFKTQLR